MVMGQHLFIRPLNKYLFFVYDVPGNILVAGDATGSKTKLPAVMAPPSSEKRRYETVNKQTHHIMLGSDKCYKKKCIRVRGQSLLGEGRGLISERVDGKVVSGE